MSEALADLDRVLRSRQEKLTPQEINVLLTCKAKCVREFMSGVLIGGTVALAATWKLSKFARVYLPVGAAAVLGSWKCNRSMNACVDHILDLDGSRIQRELATIIVNKHQNNPWIMGRMHDHFYQEKVFDDSSSNQPTVRWRYRNFFGDNVAHDQRTNDSESSNDSHVSHCKTGLKNESMEAKQAPMNADVDVMEDPLDSIFGQMVQVEEIHHPSSSSTPARSSTRSHRRYHRRRRLHHHESLG